MSEADKETKNLGIGCLAIIVCIAIGAFISVQKEKTAGNCWLKGCKNKGQGWYYETKGQKTILSQGDKYLSSGALKTAESGGYCSKEHCLKDH